MKENSIAQARRKAKARGRRRGAWVVAVGIVLLASLALNSYMRSLKRHAEMRDASQHHEATRISLPAPAGSNK